jgi:hypothetical protein
MLLAAFASMWAFDTVRACQVEWERAVQFLSRRAK